MKFYFLLMLTLGLASLPLVALDEKALQELKDYTNRKPEPLALDGVRYPQPIREISIIATDYGFFPADFVVFEGEKVKFYVTGASTTPSCFILKDYGLFLGAAKGKITEGEASFQKAGKHLFYCPTGKIEGHITVMKRQSEKERALASEKEKRRKEAWYPKDE